MDFLQQHIEALVFCSEDAVSIKEIENSLADVFDAKIKEGDIQKALDELIKKYEGDNFSFQLYQLGGGYQFMTKPAYQASISSLIKHRSNKKLSTSALETLSIIAYKQPVTRTELEQIRGVNCDYSVQKLLEKELIEIKGKAESIGRPMLYGTSARFMDYFGLNDLKELPEIKDFAKEENTVGEESEA